MILFVILSFALLHYTSASPITTADIKIDPELSPIEGYNGNSDTSISIYYIPTPGVGTHKFHKTTKKNWNDARNVCLNEGGHLVVINSAAEEAVIVKLLADSKINEEIWIGVHEQFKKDEWVSVKDERLDAIGYIHWREGEPNNFKNEGEHCLVINQQGVNDQNCDKQFFFICEI